MPIQQRIAFSALFFLLLLLHILYAYRFRFDTDEAQHLHVVWGWATGLLPYRDVFDNHGPLFHALWAPVLLAFGERADILIPMRLTMIPLVAISILCVYQIGTALWSPRIGLWAAVLTGFYPEFLFTSTEFRTDNLWTLFWLLAILLIARGRYTKKTSLQTGLLLGMAFCVTVKTGLMVGAVTFGALVIIGQKLLRKQINDIRLIVVCFAMGAIGFSITPLACLLFFYFHGALNEFLYCNISHNLVPHAQNWNNLDAHLLWFPGFLLVSLAVQMSLGKRDRSSLSNRRVFVAFTAGAYFSALKTFFPTLSRQDDLPFIPLACVCLVPLLGRWTGQMASDRWYCKIQPYSFPALLALEVGFAAFAAPFWRNDTVEPISMLSTVLSATRASDYVMDPTGEAVFRRRPFYFALESFTAVRMERGLIRDDIIHDMIATQTPVALPHGLTKNAKIFVHENYLDAGHGVWILGKRLGASRPTTPEATVVFHVTIPGFYRVLRNGRASVTSSLDGESAKGGRFLDAGEHQYQDTDDDWSDLCLLWNPAFERGFGRIVDREAPSEGNNPNFLRTSNPDARGVRH